MILKEPFESFLEEGNVHKAGRIQYSVNTAENTQYTAESG
jgi:hypothetical protein